MNQEPKVQFTSNKVNVCGIKFNTDLMNLTNFCNKNYKKKKNTYQHLAT